MVGQSGESTYLHVDNPSYPIPVEVEPPETVQLKRYFRALRRRWPVVAVALLLGALIGWVTTPKATGDTGRAPSIPYYRATHTLIGDQDLHIGASDKGSTTSSNSLAQAAFLVTTGDVPNRVAERMRVPIEDITGNVKGQALEGVNSLAITAIGTDPDQTVALANTSAEELMKMLAQSNTERYNQTRDEVLKRLETLKATRTDLEQQIKSNPSAANILDAQLDSVINQYRLTYEQFQQLAAEPSPSSGLRTIESAYPVTIDPSEYASLHHQNLAQPGQNGVGNTSTTELSPLSKAANASPSPSTPVSASARAAGGGLLGFGLGLGLVFLLDKYDTRLRRRLDVESATLLPVITEIPALSRSQQHDFSVVADLSPRSRATEAYRIIRTSLLFAWSDETNRAEAQVVMVTSPSPDEGKTTTVANLATVLAEGGMSVLVVNCDFRRPRIQKYLTDPANHDEHAIDVVGPEGPVRIVQSKIGHVDMVSGFGEHDDHTNPLEIVATQKKVIQRCRGDYDVLLLDTAPFLTTNDASELLPETDSVLLVIRSGKTRREAAARTAELLRRLQSSLLGVVFNGSNDSPAAEYYYHYYLDDAGKHRKGGSVAVPTNGQGSRGEPGVTSRSVVLAEAEGARSDP